MSDHLEQTKSLEGLRRRVDFLEKEELAREESSLLIGRVLDSHKDRLDQLRQKVERMEKTLTKVDNYLKLLLGGRYDGHTHRIRSDDNSTPNG